MAPAAVLDVKRTNGDSPGCDIGGANSASIRWASPRLKASVKSATTAATSAGLQPAGSAALLRVTTTGDVPAVAEAAARTANNPSPATNLMSICPCYRHVAWAP